MADENDRIIRHAGIDRLFHWVTAATMTVLLATSLLPIVGIRFAWYQIHWMAGIILTLAILMHVIRALFWQRLRTILPNAADLRGAGAGKYTLPQKLMHLGWSVAILVAIATGLFMMAKAGVPFMQRNPYAYSLKTWGVLTLLHDLAALLSVFLILVHVYFGILPEKRGYLRAMVKGWITRGELKQEHNLDRVARGE
ncbi:MAG: cytochrome b/b6 domain-containing protein [Pseudomonadota bacterium]